MPNPTSPVIVAKLAAFEVDLQLLVALLNPAVEYQDHAVATSAGGGERGGDGGGG
jgi:hypothetical protein